MKPISRSFALSLVLCSTASNATSAEDVQKDAHRAVDSSGRYVNERREEFQARMQDKLQALSQELEQLRHSADKQTKTARKKLDARIRSLDSQRNDLSAKLDALKKSSEERWNQLRSGLERAVNDLEAAVKGSERPSKEVHRL